MPFDTEAEAVAHVCEFLEPHCASLKTEPTFPNGLRPDIGFRLKAAPHIPLLVEVKKFESGYGGTLAAAIRQAHSYTELTGRVALVAPIMARGPSALSWYNSPLGAMGLLAAQLSVGLLYESHDGGGIFVGGQAAVRFYAANGEWETTLHRDAETLLTRKAFSGSSTWREAS